MAHMTLQIPRTTDSGATFLTSRTSYVFPLPLRLLLVATTIFFVFFLFSCERSPSPTTTSDDTTPTLSILDVQTLIAQAVEQAQRRGDSIDVAITDREGNVLGAFSMTNSVGSTTDPLFGSIAKARTAAFLSSNQHGFTSLTACFITRKHFPPGITNTPGGPLFGVPFSSIGSGDIQPNNPDSVKSQAGEALIPGAPGLTGIPGGVPIFKNGLLAGGIGISSTSASLPNGFDLDLCSGVTSDEQIAFGAVVGFEPLAGKRGDAILIDGIRFLYSNAAEQAGNFALDFNSDVDGILGTIDTNFPIVPTPTPGRFPTSGAVNLGPNFDFSIKGSTRGSPFLTATEVQSIIDNAVTQANKTRAAIRRPLGSPARVFVTVCDIDGTILGIWRTPDATLFSYDVSAQKARTVVDFSNPASPLGIQIRQIMGLASTAPFAMTCRAVGFLSQDFFPPGIDEELLGEPGLPGPLFQGPNFDFQDSIGLGQTPLGNGITVFPGAVPLYRNGRLIGGIGVSGDGVDQDDIISFAGAAGFLPPKEIRCDQFFYRGIRLPFVKFPRRPEI